MTPEMLTAIAGLVSAIAWPALVFVLILSQRKPLKRLLENLESIALPGGIEAKIRSQVNREAAEILDAEPAASNILTERQLQASERIEKLAAHTNLSSIRSQIAELAREYESLRASMRPSNERTRRMELITTKMRTLGLAAVPLLPELAESESPGARLAAVATLQVEPNSDYLDWLGQRFQIEKPFIQYHSGVALGAAARALDETDRQAIENAIATAKNSLSKLSRNTDRWRALEEAESALQEDQ